MRCFRAGRLARVSVSYTHLDVYKRQYYDTKLATARFWFERMMPHTASLLDCVTAGHIAPTASKLPPTCPPLIVTTLPQSALKFSPMAVPWSSPVRTAQRGAWVACPRPLGRFAGGG